MVVLHKLDLQADRLFKLGLVKALKEEATVITEHPGLEQHNVRNGKAGGFHVDFYSFKQEQSKRRITLR